MDIAFPHEGGRGANTCTKQQPYLLQRNVGAAVVKALRIKHLQQQLQSTRHRLAAQHCSLQRRRQNGIWGATTLGRKGRAQVVQRLRDGQCRRHACLVNCQVAVALTDGQHRRLQTVTLLACSIMPVPSKSCTTGRKAACAEGGTARSGRVSSGLRKQLGCAVQGSSSSLTAAAVRQQPDSTAVRVGPAAHLRQVKQGGKVRHLAGRALLLRLCWRRRLLSGRTPLPWLRCRHSPPAARSPALLLMWWRRRHLGCLLLRLPRRCHFVHHPCQHSGGLSQ